MINVNLIAERRSRKLRELNILRMAALGVGIIIVCMLSLNLVAWAIYWSDQNKLAGVNARLSELTGSRNMLADTERQIADRQEMVTLLDQVKVSEGAWMQILADVSRLIPHEVVVTGLTSSATGTGVELHLAGRGLDQKAVAAFMLAIPAQSHGGWAGKPVLNSLSAIDQVVTADGRSVGGVAFDLTVPIRGLLGGGF